jgi:hypothetical protein
MHGGGAGAPGRPRSLKTASSPRIPKPLKFLPARVPGHADVTVGSWMLAFNVTHFDDRRLCETSCSQSSLAVYDIPGCAGLCDPVRQLPTLHNSSQACGIWHAVHADPCSSLVELASAPRPGPLAGGAGDPPIPGIRPHVAYGLWHVLAAGCWLLAAGCRLPAAGPCTCGCRLP